MLRLASNVTILAIGCVFCAAYVLVDHTLPASFAYLFKLATSF